jgi:hypothetical protein
VFGEAAVFGQDAVDSEAIVDKGGRMSDPAS